jgi:hypothetical protein
MTDETTGDPTAAAPGPGRPRRTHHMFQPDVSSTLKEAYDWVAHVEAEQFAARLNTMRRLGNDAMAMRALHAFALRRPVDELTGLSRLFHHRDAMMVLATAALSRPVGEAATLAASQYAAETHPEDGGPWPPITYGIVHDVACQRTAFDVAVFVRVLIEQGFPALAGLTLEIFAGTNSGRTNLDKALLHTALIGEECHGEAAELLDLTLRALGEIAADAHGPGAELADLTGAFQQLSPTGQVLERWVAARLDTDRHDQKELATTVALLARLITLPGRGHETLARHIAENARCEQMEDLCERTVDRPAEGAVVRRHAAAYMKGVELARLAVSWRRNPVLTRTTRDLLADILDRRFADVTSPLPMDKLKDLHDRIAAPGGADPECASMLRRSAVERVAGRGPQDLVELLRWCTSSRERSRSADLMGRRLAAAVLGPDGDRGWFVACLVALYGDRPRHIVAVDAACRELSDPSSGTADAGLVADVARRLSAAGLGRHSWELLERFLENEQLVSPADVARVVDVVFAIPELAPSEAGPDDDRRRLLLRATVGRWSDMLKRDEAVGHLQNAGRDEAAHWIIESLR